MRLTTRLLPALLCATLLGSTLLLPAVAAPQPAGGTVRPSRVESAGATTNVTSPKFSVTPGLIFNDVKGTVAQQRRIVTQVEKAINNAPPGSRIRIAQYLFDLDSSADALIAAKKRGVHVQMLIDDNKATPQTQRVRTALGTHRTAGGSYVAKCSHSCMSSGPSVMHAKFFLFSQSGISHNVSMISSANLYTGNTAGSWNNIHTIVEDKTMYASLNTYFNDMLADRDNPAYNRITYSGVYKAYFFPRSGSNSLILLDVLNHVRCTGVAAGYGKNGKTVVRVEQWGWTSGRLDIARRLWTLHDQGCDVQIIANNFKTSAKVLQTLLRRSTKHGQLRFYNAGIDTDGNGTRDKYMHHKVVAINGVWFGHKNTKIVYTGSANFTSSGTYTNNEIILRVKGDSVWHGYAANFNFIRDKWTRRTTVAPLYNQIHERALTAELEQPGTAAATRSDTQ